MFNFLSFKCTFENVNESAFCVFLLVDGNVHDSVEIQIIQVAESNLLLRNMSQKHRKKSFRKGLILLCLNSSLSKKLYSNAHQQKRMTTPTKAGIEVEARIH